MKIDVPLEINDTVWIIKNRKARSRTVTGVRQYRWDSDIRTVYHFENCNDANIDFVYFKSKKDAEIEIAKRILDGLKNED